MIIDQSSDRHTKQKSCAFQNYRPINWITNEHLHLFCFEKYNRVAAHLIFFCCERKFQMRKFSVLLELPWLMFQKPLYYATLYAPNGPFTTLFSRRFSLHFWSWCGRKIAEVFWGTAICVKMHHLLKEKPGDPGSWFGGWRSVAAQRPIIFLFYFCSSFFIKPYYFEHTSMFWWRNRDFLWILKLEISRRNFHQLRIKIACVFLQSHNIKRPHLMTLFFKLYISSNVPFSVRL